MIIIPLHGPSCKLRLARPSAKLDLQGGLSVVIPQILQIVRSVDGDIEEGSGITGGGTEG